MSKLQSRRLGRGLDRIDEDRRSGSRFPSLPNRTGAINASGFPVSSLAAQTDLRRKQALGGQKGCSRNSSFNAVDSVSRAIDWIGSDLGRYFCVTGCLALRHSPSHLCETTINSHSTTFLHPLAPRSLLASQLLRVL
jgi:hypothetical protein